MGKNPTLFEVYPQDYTTWFEDVALGDDWASLRDVISPLFTLDDEHYTLDVEHFEDDITHMMIMMMVGPTSSLGDRWLMIWGT